MRLVIVLGIIRTGWPIYQRSRQIWLIRTDLGCRVENATYHRKHHPAIDELQPWQIVTMTRLFVPCQLKPSKRWIGQEPWCCVDTVVEAIPLFKAWTIPLSRISQSQYLYQGQPSNLQNERLSYLYHDLCDQQKKVKLLDRCLQRSLSLAGKSCPLQKGGIDSTNYDDYDLKIARGMMRTINSSWIKIFQLTQLKILPSNTKKKTWAVETEAGARKRTKTRCA